MSELSGKHVLITAGPTYEAIDPVRFIGNHSSGKMGISIAEAALQLGAEKVTLICGPTHIESDARIDRVDVRSAQEMYEEVNKRMADQDVLVLAAAVADYRPKNIATSKIKKQKAVMTIELEPTPDILSHVGKNRSEQQVIVGFALETDNEVENATEKLKRKKCDMIVLNSLKDEGAGFGHDTNRIRIIDKHNNISTFELKSKKKVAFDILNTLIALKK